MEYFIQNSKQQTLCLKVDSPLGATKKQYAFVCHGITGYKEQGVILQIVKSLQNQGYTVISFDCRNSRGKSHNDMRCATLSDFCEDLAEVIAWAKNLPDFKPPFLLAGHSLGGSAVLNYALKNPDSIERLILVSSIFSGKELLDNTQKFAPEFYQTLLSTGLTHTQENRQCFLDETYLQELQKYDFYSLVPSFQKPILFITGDKDTSSMPENNQKFYEQITAPKTLCILSDCTHIYEHPHNLEDLDRKIADFVASLVLLQ